MKNFTLTFGVVFTFFKEKLACLGYVYKEEKTDLFKEIKFAISDSKENLSLGNKVVFHFSENHMNDSFSLEHHYNLDDKNFILENQFPYRRPNKLSLFANGKREVINSAELIKSSEGDEIFIDKINEYFQRIKILNKKILTAA